MRSQLILVAGFLLSSYFPVEAQTPSAQIVLAQASPPPVLPMVLFRASPIRSSSELPERPLPHYSAPHRPPLLAAAYQPEPSLESRLQIDEFRTPMLTESSLPVADLWRGLKLDAFDSASHAPSLQRFSPTSGAGFEASRQRSGVDREFGRAQRPPPEIRLWAGCGEKAEPDIAVRVVGDREGARLPALASCGDNPADFRGADHHRSVQTWFSTAPLLGDGWRVILSQRRNDRYGRNSVVPV
jgi:hypothetical protein